MSSFSIEDDAYNQMNDMRYLFRQVRIRTIIWNNLQIIVEVDSFGSCTRPKLIRV